MIQIKFISGLDKAITSGSFGDYNEIKHVTGFPGERISFQLLLEKRADEYEGRDVPILLQNEIIGDLSEYATVREVRCVPSTVNLRGGADADYITLVSALLPDLLSPLSHGEMSGIAPNSLTSFWIELDIPADTPKRGLSTLTVKLSERGSLPSAEPFTPRESPSSRMPGWCAASHFHSPSPWVSYHPSPTSHLRSWVHT